MDRCGILQESYTTEQLKHSGTLDDFKYNVKLVIRAYKEIMVRYSRCASSTKETTDMHKPQQYLYKREGRKGYQRKGR